MLNAASCKLCFMLLLWSAVELVYSNIESYSPELEGDYPWHPGNNIHQANVLEDDFLRKRTKPSLSIVNPLDVLRQRLLLEIARRHMKENTRQVELNRAILKNVGKRHFHRTSIMDFILQQMYNKRWPDVDNYLLNQPHQYQYQDESQYGQRQMPTKGQLITLTNAYADDTYDPESTFNNLLNAWLINNMAFHLHRHNPLFTNYMKNNNRDNLRQSLSPITTTIKDIDRRKRHDWQSKMLKSDHIPNSLIETLIINPLTNLNSDATTTKTATAAGNINSNTEENLTPLINFSHKQTPSNNFLQK